MFISVIQTVICTFGALMFACAALRKLRSFEEFPAVLANYQLLPVGLTAAIATALPLTELLIAVALLIAPVRSIGLGGAAVLNVIFAFAVAINISRGRSFIDCGCGVTPGLRSSLSWSLVFSNLVLAAVFSCCAFVRTDALTWDAAAVGCLAGLNAYVLYAGYETLAVIATYPRPNLSRALRDLAWRRYPRAAT